jgi:hypothetical protein
MSDSQKVSPEWLRDQRRSDMQQGWIDGPVWRTVGNGLLKLVQPAAKDDGRK